LMFIDTLSEDMAFDRAIDTYVRVMGVPEPLASLVATRVLVELGEELVPRRALRPKASRDVSVEIEGDGADAPTLGGPPGPAAQRLERGDRSIARVRGVPALRARRVLLGGRRPGVSRRSTALTVATGPDGTLGLWGPRNGETPGPCRGRGRKTNLA
jgi:hypothetical protein